MNCQECGVSMIYVQAEKVFKCLFCNSEIDLAKRYSSKDFVDSVFEDEDMEAIERELTEED